MTLCLAQAETSSRWALLSLHSFVHAQKQGIDTLARRLVQRLLSTSANIVMEQTSSNLAWGGSLTKYKVGSSSSLGGLSTNVAVYLPPAAADKGSKVPVLYYLAGLTCNEDTGAQKGGFLRDASKHGIALVFPDTSPRGAGVSGEEDDWVRKALALFVLPMSPKLSHLTSLQDFGTGAGFYLNATGDKWKKHYNMEKYITEELPSLIQQAGLPIDISKASVFGHSMVSHSLFENTGPPSRLTQPSLPAYRVAMEL